MKKNILTITALLLALSLMLVGCGSKEPTETTAAVSNTTAPAAPAALGLKEAVLTTSTWSSPNGATVHLAATPVAYTEGDAANFVVRLEGEDVANVPCQWDGSHFTADAELNAADGLCYFLIMSNANGNAVELTINTPAQPIDEALINLETALTAYCNVMVESSTFENGKLIITDGSVLVQTPKITNDGEVISCKEAALILSLDGEALGKQAVTLTAGETAGTYTQALTDLSFDLPELENDRQLVLTLEATLSNGQILSDAGSSFYYNEGTVLTAVG